MLHYSRSEFSPPLVPASPLVIFACNGVLVDGERIVAEVAASAFTEAGFGIDAPHYLAHFTGWSIEDVCRNCEEITGRRVPHRFSATIDKLVQERMQSDLRAMPHVQHALTWLHQRRCAAATWPIEFLRRIIDRLGLSLFFDELDLVPGHRRAWPELLQQTAAARGTDPGDCIVVDHSPHGVASAAGLGMRVIGFVGGSHADESLATHLRRAGAALVIRDMRQLKTAVLELIDQREHA